MVPKLPVGTKIHHWSAVAFMLAVWRVSLAEYEVGQKLMMYGFWSTLAFPVNAFLALRVPMDKAKPAWIWALSLVSLVAYILVCFFNWGLHVVWIFNKLLHLR